MQTGSMWHIDVCRTFVKRLMITFVCEFKCEVVYSFFSLLSQIQWCRRVQIALFLSTKCCANSLCGLLSSSSLLLCVFLFEWAPWLINWKEFFVVSHLVVTEQRIQKNIHTHIITPLSVEHNLIAPWTKIKWKNNKEFKGVSPISFSVNNNKGKYSS